MRLLRYGLRLLREWKRNRILARLTSSEDSALTSLHSVDVVDPGKIIQFPVQPVHVRVIKPESPK